MLGYISVSGFYTHNLITFQHLRIPLFNYQCFSFTCLVHEKVFVRSTANESPFIVKGIQTFLNTEAGPEALFVFCLPLDFASGGYSAGKGYYKGIWYFSNCIYLLTLW